MDEWIVVEQAPPAFARLCRASLINLPTDPDTVICVWYIIAEKDYKLNPIRAAK